LPQSDLLHNLRVLKLNYLKADGGDRLFLTDSGHGDFSKVGQQM
jgi:hypothetical protein